MTLPSFELPALADNLEALAVEGQVTTKAAARRTQENAERELLRAQGEMEELQKRFEIVKPTP